MKDTTQTRTGKPRFFYGYVVVAAGFLVMAVVWGTTQTFGIFFKPVLTEFGWTRAATAGAFSLGTIIFSSLSIVAGRITDRFGPGLVVMASGLFIGLGYLLMSRISTIWQLYVFYGVLVGIGMCGSFAPGASIVARWFVKRRGLMTGLWASGFGVGLAIMSPVANWMISIYGWRTSYIVLGIITMAVIIAAAPFLKRDPSQKGLLPYGSDETETERLNSEAEGASFFQAARTRQFWLLIATFMCWGFYQPTIMVHIVPHVTDLGFSAISAANVLGIIGGVNIIGRIGIGSACDRIGSKSALVLGFAIMLASILWLQFAEELWMFYIFSVVFGLSYGGLSATMSPIVAESFGLRAHGTILGIVIFSWGIGAIIGPVVTGHIFDVTSSYHLAFVIFGVLSIANLVLALILKHTRLAITENTA